MQDITKRQRISAAFRLSKKWLAPLFRGVHSSLAPTARPGSYARKPLLRKAFCGFDAHVAKSDQSLRGLRPPNPRGFFDRLKAADLRCLLAWRQARGGAAAFLRPGSLRPPGLKNQLSGRGRRPRPDGCARCARPPPPRGPQGRPAPQKESLCRQLAQLFPVQDPDPAPGHLHDAFGGKVFQHTGHHFPGAADVAGSLFVGDLDGIPLGAGKGVQ